MSTQTSLVFISQQVTKYLFTPILIFGVLGGCFNLLIFLSLRTFRENSCAFYLTIGSLANIGGLLSGLLWRLMNFGYNIDWTSTSIFYCKFRVFCLQESTLLSFTCICLAAIDQFLATSTRLRWQRWCNTKVAHRLVLFFSCLWMLHGISIFPFYNHVLSAATNQTVCIVTNSILTDYINFGYIITLQGILPYCVTLLFGYLAYRNVQQISYRTIPLVRRELDKQLTNIVLLQIVYNFLFTTPYIIIILLQRDSSINSSSEIAARLQFANVLALSLYFLAFTCPFYVYICISERFRRQFIYVVSKIFYIKDRQRNMTIQPIG
ncbi:unnamed protein product [Adineta ricciae]|uniref:G-protein coupled receptors family 1 profile domain-containing protein n=1 Tax=Adineta ricciae TaxID=249248 RepID=A0A815UVS2_ADIRI|nr:unnamed protein product [Adineta ricciae]CAF1521561.1 unnamed protein product [Adineta ricciae]